MGKRIGKITSTMGPPESPSHLTIEASYPDGWEATVSTLGAEVIVIPSRQYDAVLYLVDMVADLTVRQYGEFRRRVDALVDGEE